MLTSCGLITASAVLVHLSGGYIELHFHFFVMLIIIALYQEWLPFLLAIAYVAVHHRLLGTLAPALSTITPRLGPTPGSGPVFTPCSS